jgi:hypothetical protein
MIVEKILIQIIAVLNVVAAKIKETEEIGGKIPDS